MKTAWISNRYFSNVFTYDERTDLIRQYDDEQWGKAKSFLNERRNKITPNAVALSKKIKDQINIELFPLIILVATKGWMSSGCARFAMVAKHGEWILFDYTTKEYLLKKHHLEMVVDKAARDRWITIKDNVNNN